MRQDMDFIQDWVANYYRTPAEREAEEFAEEFYQQMMADTLLMRDRMRYGITKSKG